MTLIELISSVVITIVPIWGLLPSDDICGWEVAGNYTEGKIYICDGENREFSKYHEYGHYLLDRGYFSDKDIETYKKLFNNDLKKGIRAFHSDYEMSSWEEDFCTNLSAIFLWQKSKISLQKRIKFIKLILSKL